MFDRSMSGHTPTLSSTLPAEWSSITSITLLDLRYNSMSGSLPAEWSAMSNLTQLILSGNSMSGSLPAEWSSMTSLTVLDLSNSSMRGSLAADWSTMSSLGTHLNRNGNVWLSGSLPAEWSTITSLRELNLEGNGRLSGSLPAQWSTMSSLTQLNLKGNGRLSGSLPAQWSTMTSLTQLNLYSVENRLSGSLPAKWSTMTSLTQLNLYSVENRLSGSLPAKWSTMTSLTQLNLYSVENRLSGSLPAKWSTMTSLTQLNLYSVENRLSGSLPAKWSTMTSLTQLNLYSVENRLSGSLPAKWSTMTSLTQLNLYSEWSSLSGSLPAEWSSMSSLTALDLVGDNMSGSLPAEWSSMSSLKELYLQAQNMSGSLPAEWSSMSSLTQLTVWGCKRVFGSLPAGWSTMSSLTELTLSYSNLSGSLPAEWSSMTSLRVLDLSRNSLSGTLPPSLGSVSSLVSISMFCNNFWGKLLPDWGLLQSLENAELFCQGVDGFSGGMPAKWRRWCTVKARSSPYVLFQWCRDDCGLCGSPLADIRTGSCIWPKAIKDTSLHPGQSFWQALKHSWRENGCTYRYAYEALVSFIVVLPVSLICMIAVGIFIRRRTRTQVMHVRHHQQSNFGGRVFPVWLRELWKYAILAVGMARPILVGVDVVTDTLAISQVWGSWVGYVLLAVVFIPNLVTATVLSIRLCGCVPSQGLADGMLDGGDGLVVEPMGVSEARAQAAHGCSRVLHEVQMWAAKPLLMLEGFTVMVNGRHPSLIWRAFCTLAMWPVHLVASIPMMLLYSGVCKSLLVDASHGFKLYHPENVYILYDRLTGSIEAPVSAGLYIMLLVLGVRPDNMLVVEEPLLLYVPLIFSIIHTLFFWWDMVYVASTSLSWGQWWVELASPFNLAAIRRHGQGPTDSSRAVTSAPAGSAAFYRNHNEGLAGELGLVDMEAEVVAQSRSPAL